MGREGNFEIKRIENTNSRRFTFDMRRNALLKLADELSILCDAQIAIIIFSDTGDFHQHSSSNSEMEQILLRRSRLLESSEVSEEADSGEVKDLENKIAELRTERSRIFSEKARLEEQCDMLENENRQIVEQLQSSHQPCPCPAERKNSIVQDDGLAPDAICGNSSVAEDAESDTSLHNRLSSNARAKRKLRESDTYRQQSKE